MVLFVTNMSLFEREFDKEDLCLLICLNFTSEYTINFFCLAKISYLAYGDDLFMAIGKSCSLFESVSYVSKA